jgi:hypothetical protein
MRFHRQGRPRFGPTQVTPESTVLYFTTPTPSIPNLSAILLTNLGVPTKYSGARK